MRTIHFVVAALLAAGASPASAQLSTERVLSGLDQPMFVTSPPGDPRLFIVQREGQIRIWDGNQVLATPFLDITGPVDPSGEGGLLGLAFAPDYAMSRAFYIYYTANGSGGNPLESRVSRFRASQANPDVADPQEKILLRVDQPFDNHNGGTVAFGPDGYLYFGLGDGGDAGDPGDRAQDGNELLGKMLRLDVAFTGFNDDYDIPADNPFVGPDGIRDEIWDIGLRNPFRFSFDRVEGDLYIGDVGQGRSRRSTSKRRARAASTTAGTCSRGRSATTTPIRAATTTRASRRATTLDLEPPVHEYAHTASCNSVTGGVVYRGPVTALQGQYLFGDYCRLQIWSFVWDGVGGTDGPVVERTAELQPDVGSIDSIIAFGEDAAGEVYIVDGDGEIFRIAPEPGAPLLLAVGGALLALSASARRTRSRSGA